LKSLEITLELAWRLDSASRISKYF